MISYASFAERLARGQLKNTAAVENTNLGEICPDYVDTILSLTNQGLVDLSSRVVVIKKQVDLIFVADQYVYNFLDVNIAGYLDITLTGDTFDENDFLKVLDVFDADGLRHPVNTQGQIMTPLYNSIRFTADKMEVLDPKVRIRYQSKHPVIAVGDNINISPNFEIALQLFVASLYISHMNGKDHTIKGDKYFASYLRQLGEDIAQDVSGTSEVEGDLRFDNRGFV